MLAIKFTHLSKYKSTFVKHVTRFIPNFECRTILMIYQFDDGVLFNNFGDQKLASTDDFPYING